MKTSKELKEPRGSDSFGDQTFSILSTVHFSGGILVSLPNFLCGSAESSSKQPDVATQHRKDEEFSGKFHWQKANKYINVRNDTANELQQRSRVFLDLISCHLFTTKKPRK